MWSVNKRKAVCVALALLLLSGCSAKSAARKETILSEAPPDKIKDYETYEVIPNDIVKSGSLTLSVVYTQSQALYAPENDLTLERVLVERKDHVAAGEPIASFRRASSEAELSAAQLALSRAEESLNAQLESLQERVDSAASRAGTELGNIQLELAQLDYDRAVYTGQRQLDQLQAAVDAQQAAFEPVLLCAPYDCRIDSIAYLYDKQPVNQNTLIVEISRLDSMMLIGESSTSNFQYGNTIQVEYGKKTSRQHVSAQVVSTSALLGQDKQKIWVRLDEPLEEEALTKPNAKSEYVQIRDALTVPRAAIEAESGNYYVQILVDGIVHKRYIIRGISVGTAGDGHVVVLSGLEPGQMVITN